MTGSAGNLAPPMDIQRSSQRIHLFLVATAFALVALATIAAGSARAEDTFRFDNQTGEGFTAFSEGPGECWSRPGGALAWQSEPHLSGSISADVGLFEGCKEWWAANLSYEQEFWEGYEDTNGEYIDLWRNGVGTMNFWAEDPEIGPATLRCEDVGTGEGTWGSRPISNEMTSEVEGTTCTMSWLPGAGPSADSLDHARPLEPAGAKYTRFVDSLAPVKGDIAHVSVQAFGLQRLAVEDQVALRTRGGQLIGETTTTLWVGERAKSVAVKLAPVALQEIKKHGYLMVDAKVTHVDGSKGDGDSTAELVLRRDGVPRHPAGGRPPKRAAHHY